MERHALTFEAIRPEVLERLVDVRGNLDPTPSGAPPAGVRQEFEAVLDRMQSYLLDGDVEKYRSFTVRWVAFRLGQGSSPENLIHSVVALGDVILDVARGRLPAGWERAEFARAIARMSLFAARVIVDALAEELASMEQAARRRG
jgi:hypothetical protein